jgi:hypothetical protein
MKEKTYAKRMDRQEAVAFRYHERLHDIVRDLENIDRLIPAEASRHGSMVKDQHASAIIEARKSDLLRYIQTICRDHIFWGNKLLNEGWIAKRGNGGGK